MNRIQRKYKVVKTSSLSKLKEEVNGTYSKTV